MECHLQTLNSSQWLLAMLQLQSVSAGEKQVTSVTPAQMFNIEHQSSSFVMMMSLCPFNQIQTDRSSKLTFIT